MIGEHILKLPQLLTKRRHKHKYLKIILKKTEVIQATKE